MSSDTHHLHMCQDCELLLLCLQISKDMWPFVQWEVDEGACVLVATNTLQVYSKADNFAGELSFAFLIKLCWRAAGGMCEQMFASMPCMACDNSGVYLCERE